MKPGLKTAVVLTVFSLLCGCRMCQTPFDYCGPVLRHDGCPNCDFGARRGSAFHPMEDGTPPVSEVSPTPLKAPADRTDASPTPTETPLDGSSELPAPGIPDADSQFEPGPAMPE